MAIAPHKKLYTGPTYKHGQQMRGDILHTKGHGTPHHMGSRTGTVNRPNLRTTSRDGRLTKTARYRKAKRVLLGG